MHRKIILMMLMAFVMMPVLGICETIDWKKYNEGIRLAQKEKKKVFIFFQTDWCGYCAKMEQTTFQDTSVSGFLNEHFVSIKVNGDKEPSLVNDYKVGGYPDNRFLDEKRKAAFRVPGFVDAATFLFFLEYIQTDNYKTMDPMEYYKTR